MENLKKEFKDALVEVWYKKAISDYEKSYYYTEDSLKVRLYYNITKKLGVRFFERNNLRLLTEYHIPKIGYADMALVDISEDDWKVVSVIELKNKYLNTRCEEEIKKDYKKVRKYQELSKDIDIFMVSVNTNVDDESTGVSWCKIFDTSFHNERFTELMLDESEDNVHLRIYDWHYKNNTDKAINYIKLNEGLCDDCLSDMTNITPRQQINQICSSLEDTIRRVKGSCKECNKTKITNWVLEY